MHEIIDESQECVSIVNSNLPLGHRQWLLLRTAIRELSGGITKHGSQWLQEDA